MTRVVSDRDWLRAVTNRTRIVLYHAGSKPMTIAEICEKVGANESDVVVAVNRLFDSKEATRNADATVSANIENIIELARKRR